MRISGRNTLLALSVFTAGFFAPLRAQNTPSPYHPKKYSVLSASPTLKVEVEKSGVYKITYEDLAAQKLLSSPVSCAKMAVYGNVSGSLPFFNTSDIYDDLAHLPVQINDLNGDGNFGPGDYLLFYGESQTRYSWKSDKTADISKNPYSDKTFYFVGTGAEYALRVETLPAQNGSDALVLTSSNEAVLHETDRYNLCNGGVNWYGELLTDMGGSVNINLQAPSAETGQNAVAYIKTAALTSSGSGTVTVNASGKQTVIQHNAVQGDNCADHRETTVSFALNTENPVFGFDYKKTSAAGYAYIDRILLFYQRKLSLENGSLNFRRVEAAAQNAVFKITSSKNLQVWDVSDIYNIKQHTLTHSGSQWSFTALQDGALHEYTVFNAETCPAPVYAGLVQPQNLHQLSNIDYVIVSHPDFMEQARQIAEFHHRRDNYRTLAVSTQEVYNEFSSGAKDPCAFRLLMRKLKMNSDAQNAPRFLCLFGAASYDYRNIGEKESDFVPTVESFGDNHENAGVPLDDNFAYLDDSEGISPVNDNVSGIPDIAVGRIPVYNAQQAADAVEKIKTYYSPASFGAWRNEIAAVTDDSFEDGMESFILGDDDYMNRHPEYNITKIYSDAYLRNSTTAGTRIPRMEKAVRNSIENGSLFIGYLGHSGWDSWSDEKVFSLQTINNLSASNFYPVGVASSCSFALFDQADQVCGAEQFVLRAKGGGIAMVGTTRTALVGSIEDLQGKFLAALSDKNNGKTPTVGESYLYAKIHNSQADGHKFVLLGDPGVRVAVPQYNVTTTRISQDTLKALANVEVEGCITDNSGNVLSGFNGLLTAKVYDKPFTSQTLGVFNSRTHENNKQVYYTQQNSLLFQGTVQVDSGYFRFGFIVPKDIQYRYGQGKISYYAYSGDCDANGSFTNFTVGGFSDNPAVLDTAAPVIKLHIGSENSNGTTVGLSPTLYADISDLYGINTTGSGFGHDMTLVIDGNEKEKIVVNSLFEYDLGSYSSGKLSYLLNDLEPGPHTVKLKAWNINNISATAVLKFNVNNGKSPAVFDVVAAPNPNTGACVDFYFTHNGEAGCISGCTVQVFNLTGGLVASLNYNLEEGGSAHNAYNERNHAVGPLRWEPSRNGTALQPGVYICRVVLNGTKGSKQTGFTRLIVL